MPYDHEPDSAPSQDAFHMLVQLTQETRDDVKHIRTVDLPLINDRLTRLEASAEQRENTGAKSWSPLAKTGVGVGALLPLAYAAVELLRATGVLPPAPVAPVPAPTSLSAPAE